MKKMVLLFVFTCCLQIQAQNTCYTATNICNNSTFSVGSNAGVGVSINLPVSNPTNSPFPPNAGRIFSGALNPTWMIFTVANPGILGFSIGDNAGPTPQIAFHDWIMWPYSTNACTTIFNDSLPPLRCNWNGHLAARARRISLATPFLMEMFILVPINRLFIR